MKNADKRTRQRTNPISSISRFSASPNLHMNLRAMNSEASLDHQIPANEPSDTVVNIEVPDTHLGTSITSRNFNVHEPAISCATLDDPTPCYDAPPSYEDCVQYDSWQSFVIRFFHF